MTDNKVAAAERAKELGLPEGSTWTDISKHNNKVAAAERAKELGLPEGSTWTDISKLTSATRPAAPGERNPKIANING